MDRKLTIPTIIIAVLVLVNVYFFIGVIHAPSSAAVEPVFNTAQAFILPPSQPNYLPLLDTSVSDPKLDAKSAIVYDLNADRNLYEKNTKDKLPIASLTKILNVIVTWEKFSPNDVVTIKPSAVKVDGTRQDVFAGETLSVNSLLQMMLVESSNDAAYAMRDYAASRSFDLVAAMNTKAAALGMHDTEVVDPAGLNDSGYSTAADLVKAVRYALRYDALWSFSRQPTATIDSTDGKFSHAIKSTDQLLGVIANIVGGKTGYTDGALGCMILIIDAPSSAAGPGDKIISVVLGSHDRFGDMKNLVDWTKRAYRWQ